VYHLKINFFNHIFLPGGFLGVDIFFVISGYLISLIILKEIEIKKGKFSFIDFYKRRARRIFPALFTVMLFTIPLVFYFVTPNFLIEYSKSLIFSLFFLSNYYFWKLGAGYDQIQFIGFQPFLHTWSLSIEEQFYLFYPLILVFFFFFKKENFNIINWYIYNHIINFRLSFQNSRFN
jgi:peptidoglycan/LPS O-acetylase OafA/YrhL